MATKNCRQFLPINIHGNAIHHWILVSTAARTHAHLHTHLFTAPPHAKGKSSHTTQINMSTARHCYPKVLFTFFTTRSPQRTKHNTNGIDEHRNTGLFCNITRVRVTKTSISTKIRVSIVESIQRLYSPPCSRGEWRRHIGSRLTGTVAHLADLWQTTTLTETLCSAQVLIFHYISDQLQIYLHNTVSFKAPLSFQIQFRDTISIVYEIYEISSRLYDKCSQSQS